MDVELTNYLFILIGIILFNRLYPIVIRWMFRTQRKNSGGQTIELEVDDA